MKKLKALAIERLKALPKRIRIGDNLVQVVNVTADSSAEDLTRLRELLCSGTGIEQRFLINIDISHVPANTVTEAVNKWKSWFKMIEGVFGNEHQAPPP